MAEAFPITAHQGAKDYLDRVLSTTWEVLLLLTYTASSGALSLEGPTASPNSSANCGVSNGI